MRLSGLITAIESRDVSEWIDALEKLAVIADHLLEVGAKSVIAAGKPASCG
jgi:hypothetical protein